MFFVSVCGAHQAPGWGELHSLLRVCCLRNVTVWFVRRLSVGCSRRVHGVCCVMFACGARCLVELLLLCPLMNLVAFLDRFSRVSQPPHKLLLLLLHTYTSQRDTKFLQRPHASSRFSTPAWLGACGGPQEDITNTYDVFITVVFVFGVIGIFGAGTIRYRMGFAGDVTIFQVRRCGLPWLSCGCLAPMPARIHTC